MYETKERLLQVMLLTKYIDIQGNVTHFHLAFKINALLERGCILKEGD